MGRLHLLMMIAALVCFILATLNVGGKFNLIAAGLALWIATLIF